MNKEIKKVINLSIHTRLLKADAAELANAIETPNLAVLIQEYKNEVKKWAAYVDLKLNNDYIKCPITLYNEVNHCAERLELINKFQRHIEYVAILQGILDEET
jgi:hypothetical protein